MDIAICASKDCNDLTYKVDGRIVEDAEEFWLVELWFDLLTQRHAANKALLKAERMLVQHVNRIEKYQQSKKDRKDDKRASRTPC